MDNLRPDGLYRDQPEAKLNKRKNQSPRDCLYYSLLPPQTNTCNRMNYNDGFVVSKQATKTLAPFQTGNRTAGRWWAGGK